MDYSAARRTMVENQIRTNRIVDPSLIEAMSQVPREAFVPPRLRGIAYIDEDIPLGAGRYLVEPLVMARLLQAAEILPEDVVLEIGCATGYGSALLAHLASAVVALDSDPGLLAHAREALAMLELNTVSVVEGSLRDGYPQQAPYDVIVVSGAVSRVPDAIFGQLAEGGRLVAVIGDGHGGGLGRGSLFVRKGGAVSRRIVFDGATPMLPGFEPEPAFRF